ncbi:uncharacterized protein [Paramisgurnus dabryanus]|uniref:uncharacterized protein isoform X1 n=1 Tax=Paramisgurnus dabryanus TaxID=90735 RepID=UPI0031F3C30B
MSLLILIAFQLFLEVKTQGLPKAKLTVSPASVTDGEMRFVCEGFKKRRVSECMFYPSGRVNLSMPSASCNISITASDLLAWSGDHESSHVNIVCYYTVSKSGKHTISPHSDEVSVRVRGLDNSSTMMFSTTTSQDGGFSTGSAVTSSVSPITENSSTMMFSSQTSQEALPTMSTQFTTDITSFAVTSSAETTSDPITNASSLITRNRHVITDPANKATEPNKNFNTKMLFSIMVAAAGGGLVLVGLMVICMYRCKRRQRAERIWFESTIKKRGGVPIPKVGSGSCGDEGAVYYSNIDVLPSTAEPSGIKEEQSKQTEVELNHLYSTLTQPAINDNGNIYSEPTPQ